ncbi:MAG: RNA-protein complex protein Nop10 [Candidatus Bathyarchaeia archaeon]
MKWLIKRCGECGEYTLKETCPRCGSDTRTPHPPRFSLEDKYARYRFYTVKSGAPYRVSDEKGKDGV